MFLSENDVLKINELINNLIGEKFQFLTDEITSLSAMNSDLIQRIISIEKEIYFLKNQNKNLHNLIDLEINLKKKTV